MKKLLFTAGILSLTLTSCKGDDEVSNVVEAFDCLQAVIDASDAANAYDNDNSAANCIAYRDALLDLINEDCVGGNTTSTQDLIDALGCS